MWNAASKANDTRFNIVQLLSNNKFWTRLRLDEYSFNFCWATTPFFENGGRGNVVIGLCCESWCCAKKRKRKKIELEMAIIKNNLFRDINYTPSPVGRSHTKRRRINLQKFLRVDFTSLKELPQLQTPVIFRQASRWTQQTQLPPKEKACHNASNTG